ncbi:MAG: dTDP-4-dehydrorhamnose reductase [Afipia sp. 62-7]|nr:dTDP-4-dehydrorhamnose reductase [Afipia sp.]OJU21498.1 MAG: dTDP-4-dehydrorhamnose reductase [Afipia sp. 62-7]
MKTLLLGADGQVGLQLRGRLARLGDVVALNRTGCDLAVADDIRRAVAASSPDIIVNAAAYTAVDRAEDEEALALAINGTALTVIGEEARRRNAAVIHYSTDYVFDGSKDAPYAEADPVGPLNAYGRSKLAGEVALREAGCDHLVLRTSWVFSSHGQNFVRTMLRLTVQRDELKIVSDQTGAPTWANDIAAATESLIPQMMEERRVGRFASEILHLSGAGETTWHGFATEIVAEGETLLPERMGRAARLVAIPSSEYPVKARRPLNSRLSNRRIEERYGIRLRPWNEALALCLKEMPPEDLRAAL